MNRRMHIGMISVLVMALSASTAAEKPLRIYLPQEVRIDGEAVELGSVGILLGDAALIETARSISLGTFAVEGQALLVDRNTILSRLASGGIRAAQVQLLGADIVRIRRHEITVDADRIVDCARRYLQHRLADYPGVVLNVLRPPGNPIVSADGGAIELQAVEDHRQGGGVCRVRVMILQGGESLAHEDVFFSVRYPVRRVTAAQELSPGTLLTSENIRVETAESDQPEPEGWTVPYGMVTRQRIAPGAVVTDAVLEARQEPVVIRRRQNVQVRIDNDILFISAFGEAMEDGRVGEIIRVRRGQRPQERIIVCRVQADGTVEPLL